jgi:hypothetical protein
MAQASGRMPRKGIALVLFAFIALVALGLPRAAPAAVRIHAGVNIGVGDYDYLSDYGEWIDLPPFGAVWHPYVVEDWEPFYHGHWSWTNDGWAWISYEPFGWLVYHYGYWYRNPRVGWFWIPGTMWSPARVEWYTFGDYCGWAPLPPPHYSWRDPWSHPAFNVWVVVNIHDFADENIGRHRISGPFPRETYRRGIGVRKAPGIRDVERYTQRQIPMVRISRERVNMRPKENRPARYSRPREEERMRMVLPESEMNRVKQHAPEVERNVLIPRSRAPREEQRPQEKRPEQSHERRTRRR